MKFGSYVLQVNVYRLTESGIFDFLNRYNFKAINMPSYHRL